MDRWFSSIVKDISSLGDKVFVYDPSRLLSDASFKGELTKSYTLYEFFDDASLFIFFSKNRSNRIIVYSSKRNESFFVRSNFRILELRLEEVFPELESNLVKRLDPRNYQTLYSDYCARKNLGLDIGSTEEFILKSLWNIDLSKLHSLTENFKIALTYIIDDTSLPEYIVNGASKRLEADLKELKISRGDFVAWIKNQITIYIAEKESGRFPRIKLSDPFIQFYLLKLSLSDHLELPIEDDLIYKEMWLAKFKQSPDQEIIKKKITALISDYRYKIDELTKKEFSFNELDDITTVSRLFCEILYLIQTNDNLTINDFINIESEYENFDKLFKAQLINSNSNNYENLFYGSQSNKPLTVDKVLDYSMSQFKAGIALIVMDGMSFDEWFLLREHLQEFTVTEKSLFAILPTVTSFSRTAILSGKTPREFMNQKYQVNEEKEFINAITERGFNKDNVLYGHINLKTNIVKTGTIERHFEHLKGYDYLALICSLFDEISHEPVITDTGKRNFYKNVRNHLAASKLKDLIKQLKADGYKIIITSDHGNVFCRGNGIKTNKNLQICTESSRCLFYENENFASEVVSENPEKLFSYTYAMLPKGLILVLPVRNDCFKNNGDLSITHGGISPEELIVPLVVLE